MPRRRRREEVVSVTPLVRQLKEISLSQYFTEKFMFYLVPLYCNVVIQDLDTGEQKTFIAKQNYVLLSERDGDEIRIRLVPFSNEVMSQYGIYVKHTPSILEPKIPQKLLDDIVSNSVVVPRVHDTFAIIRSIFETYIDFPDPRLYTLCSIWVIGTYFYTMFSSYPYLYITGMKHSGKTKSLEVFERICYNAMFSTDISPASLFRVVEDTGATILIDEAEKINQEIRRLLLSGYKFAGKVYRVEEGRGKEKTVIGYNVYCPKAIANIEGIDDVLEDRCINISMLRGKKKEVILREVPKQSPKFERAKYMLYTLALTRWHELYKIYRKIVPPLELDGRTWELWKPIFSIAVWILSDFLGTPPTTIIENIKRYINSPILKDIYSYLQDRIREKQTIDLTENLDYMVVQALLSLVVRDDWYSISEIKNKVIEMFVEDEKEAKKLTTSKIANILQRHLRIRKVKKVGNRRYFYITRQHIEDVAIRLGINLEVIEDQITSSASNEETVIVVGRIERLENPQSGVCEYCGENKLLVAKIDGHYICEDCLREIEARESGSAESVVVQRGERNE